MSVGAEDQARLAQELDFRACCGKLRWALLDMVEGLVGQNVRLRGLRWGPGEVPLDLDVDTRPATEVVETVLAETERFFGASSSSSPAEVRCWWNAAPRLPPRGAEDDAGPAAEGVDPGRRGDQG
jgi:hypothetical protein